MPTRPACAARIQPAGATYGYLLKTASKDRLRRATRCVFVEGRNIIDREMRGPVKARAERFGRADESRVRDPARHRHLQQPLASLGARPMSSRIINSRTVEIAVSGYRQNSDRTHEF
jgi:hypothetical protein